MCGGRRLRPEPHKREAAQSGLDRYRTKRRYHLRDLARPYRNYDRLHAQDAANSYSLAYECYLQAIEADDNIADYTSSIAGIITITDAYIQTNNYEEAQNIIGQLLAAASMFHSCIVCVLHQNKAVEDKTLRGALGSELQNKSYETYECVKKAETQIFTIKQTATRKYDMPNEVAFCLSPQGLPTLCTVIDNESEDAPKEYDLRDMFRQSLMGHSEMRAGALKAQVKMRYGITSDTTYGGLLVEALNQGIVLRRAVSNREVYYQPGPNLYEQTLDFGG